MRWECRTQLGGNFECHHKFEGGLDVQALVDCWRSVSFMAGRDKEDIGRRRAVDSEPGAQDFV